MISSKMNRTNGGSRSSRIFVGILLIALACLVVLYYHEHRTAKQAETLSITVEQQTRTLDESAEKFVALKEACSEEREELTRVNQDQEAKIDTALQQAQDWQQRYERVINDKNTMENELKALKSEIQALQQKYDEKQNEVSSLRGQLASKAQQCENDKQLAADEAVKIEQVKCAADKQELTQVHQQLLQDKQQLQFKYDQCESSMKGFTEQLKKETEQQGVHLDHKSISLPSLKDQDHHRMMTDQLSQKLKEKFVQHMEDDKPDGQSNQLTPDHDGNLSSKDDIMSYFNNKQDEKDVSNLDKQHQQQSYPTGKKQDHAELAMAGDSHATNDHMIHVGISHDKTNDSDVGNVQKDDVNKTSKDDNHNGTTDGRDDGIGHIGEADDHHDDHHDHDDYKDKPDDQLDSEHDNNQGKTFNKLLLDGGNNNYDDDDDGNHDNGAETDQDLFKIPRLPDLRL